MTISASFSNCTMTRRISYNSGYASDMVPPDLTPDLIWYKCVVGDLGTNTIKNYATNVNDTTFGNPTISTQQYKTRKSSLYLNGTQYIEPQGIDFSKYACTTFCCWFKFLPSQSSSTYLDFVIYKSSGSWENSYLLDLLNGTGIKSYINGQQLRHDYPTSLTNNTWNHIAFVGGGLSTTMTIYVNGQLFVSYVCVSFTRNINTNYH